MTVRETKLPKTHPRILLDAEDWDNTIERNKNNPEAQAYIRKADKCLNHPLKHLEDLGVELVQQERGNGRWWLTDDQFFYIHNGNLRAHGFNAVTGTTNTPSGL